MSLGTFGEISVSVISSSQIRINSVRGSNVPSNTSVNVLVTGESDGRFYTRSSAGDPAIWSNTSFTFNIRLNPGNYVATILKSGYTKSTGGRFTVPSNTPPPPPPPPPPTTTPTCPRITSINGKVPGIRSLIIVGTPSVNSISFRGCTDGNLSSRGSLYTVTITNTSTRNVFMRNSYLLNNTISTTPFTINFSSRLSSGFTYSLEVVDQQESRNYSSTTFRV